MSYEIMIKPIRRQFYVHPTCLTQAEAKLRGCTHCFESLKVAENEIQLQSFSRFIIGGNWHYRVRVTTNGHFFCFFQLNRKPAPCA